MQTYDRDDLLFQLFDVAKLDSVIEGTDLDREAVLGILDTADQIARDQFEPLAKLLDENEPQFQDGRAILPEQVKPAMDAFVEAGFISSGFKPEHGGMGLPEIVHQAAGFIFGTANGGLSGYGMLTVGAGRLIQSFGSEAQKKQYLEPMAEGRWFGTMCLSEPQAGSSLSDITTRADEAEDGSYRISGRKMWISGGEQELTENIVHLLLAKIPGSPPGVKGISLFIVPKFRPDGTRNDIALAGLNHKMGNRGTTNTALNFGDNGDCYAELVGAPNKGLAYMFQMMNEARIGVGLAATASAQAGYQASLAYAKDRPQGRAPVAKDPTSPQIAIIEHADVRRLLLAQKAAAEPALALALYCAALVGKVEEGDQQAALLLDILTPVAKSWPSEFCLEANKHAIQVLGGAGYTRDYPVERHYRDNRLNPIHEGTHGIQGLDLLGRKALMNGGAGLKLLAQTIRADCAAAQNTALAGQLDEVLSLVEKTTLTLAGALSQDAARGLANATLYLDCFGHVIMGWMWLRLSEAAHDLAAREGDSDFLKGKAQAARYFFARELPRVEGWCRTLSANDQSAFDMEINWF